ncbi:hypothetical protein [Planobispora longispora]|uniref:Uncharacterized protein n=1 Tax=Planobispora longispora TaxID=28887 RepID=A0A8J3W4N7_9ACTN|nr:hypothetical protein [Planobispora longispora]BFE84474.1 hypothetical protein GCM10020093_070750 [Planobispora longispora]GIH75665.1 hypothetical protein Plo01_20940 [Planobispora longispora]
MASPRFLPLLRAAVALQAVAILVQAITAGLLLSSPGGRTLHAASAGVLLLAGLLHLAAAVLVWRPGGGPPRAIAPAAGLLVATLVEMALGMAHLKALHVPVGVLMFGGSVVRLVQVWADRRADATAAV